MIEEIDARMRMRRVGGKYRKGRIHQIIVFRPPRENESPFAA